MCRLVLMNKNGEKEIEKGYGLTNFLSYLEDKFGGHGNGVSLLKNGKVICLEKGVNLTVKEIANIIRKNDYDWCIFHTRLASVGSKCDENCHPFMIGTEVMAMNGTEKTEELLTCVKDITDTEAILNVKEKFDLEVPALAYLHSIFVGFSKGKPYVVANNTYNIKLMYKKKSKAIVFASEFPEKFKKNIYYAIEPFIWQDEEIDMLLFKKYIRKQQARFGVTNFNRVNAINDRDYFESLYDYYDDVLLEEEYLEKLKEEGVMSDVA